MSLERWRSDDVSILCEEAACELDTVLQKVLLEGARLPHELQWDKSPLLWGTEERSQSVISLVISRGVHRDSLVAQTVKSACNVGDPGWIPGEGNDNPLQYCCLENPMSGGAWGATVHRVAKSQTWLNDFTLGVCKLQRALTCLWSLWKYNWLKTTVKISFFYFLYILAEDFSLIGRRLSSKTGKTYFEKVTQSWLPQSPRSKWQSYIPLFLESS